MGALRRRTSRSTPLAPLSAVQKVERSWHLVAVDLEAAGIDFFTRIFLDVPSAMDLFLKVLRMDVDEMDEIKGSREAIARFVKENRMIKAHARLVIMEVGRCVAGLYDTKILVPRLRSLGRMHGAAGVKPEHYDVFFKHLFETVRDRIVAEHPEAWDGSTAEAWATVHDCMLQILSQPEESAGSVDGGGDLNKWGVVCGMASVYACLVTPLRIAGMIGYGNVVGAGTSRSFGDWMTPFRSLGMYELAHNFGFAALDVAVAVIFLVELIGCLLLRVIKVRDVRRVRNISSRKLQRATLFGKCVIIVRSLGMHEAVTFPITDALFLASYFLALLGGSAPTCDADAEWTHNNDTILDDPTGSFSRDTLVEVGVHWTWGFGVLRLVAFFRAVFVMRSFEIMYTVNQHPGSSTRMMIRIARLVLALAYTSHVAACLYVLVARIELGPQTYYDADRAEELATAFFPDPTIFGTENGMITNYLRCVHFAFCNLAGIGSHDSVPRSALECLFMLCVNALGATLYAFTTGNLLSMIEPQAERAMRFADSAAELADFMTEVGLTEDDQDRFIQGFVLREMVGNKSPGSDGGNGPFAAAPGENATSPAYPVEVAKNLPRHLQEELRAVAMVDAMKRRERAFRRCSNDFLTALTSSLKQTIVLLPGDYIVHEGQPVPAQLLVVEQGTLEVVADGNNVRTFERGDMVSFHWVTSGKLSVSVGRSSQCTTTAKYSPLLLSETIASASVRAMDHCRIATGLSSKSEKKDIKKKYPSDWRELEEVLEFARGKRKKSIREDDIPNDTNGFHNGGISIDGSGRSRKGRNSLTKTIRRVSVAVQHAPKSAIMSIAMKE